MIDWINQISYTGFYYWLIGTVHPLIMLAALAIITLCSTFCYTRRILCVSCEDRVDAHLFLAFFFSIWTVLSALVTYECFRVHGVKEGEPLVVVVVFSFCLYFLVGIAGIKLGFKEENE